MKIEIDHRLLLAALAGAVVAVPVTVSAVPTLISFSAGQPIRAADINSNFSTLRTAIQSLEAGDRCKVHVASCSSAVCQLTCPSGTHVEGGGCDAVAGVPITESMPAMGGNFTNGEHDIDFFTLWNCESDSTIGNIQGVYAYCCQN